jgi:hypothetical protein
MHVPFPNRGLRAIVKQGDGDLEIGHFAVDLVGGQHEQPAHEDCALDKPSSPI